MTTYVNGKVCSTINKGVFQTPDGRFAVSTDAIFLFASTNESFAPGLQIKYFEFRPHAMSTDVRPPAHFFETHAMHSRSSLVPRCRPSSNPAS
jgi:hypothetical protein